jgi:hypothetical protein
MLQGFEWEILAAMIKRAAVDKSADTHLPLQIYGEVS